MQALGLSYVYESTLHLHSLCDNFLLLKTRKFYVSSWIVLLKNLVQPYGINYVLMILEFDETWWISSTT